MSLSNQSLIKGTYLPPGDKSISHRILILAGQAIGKSIITNLLEGEDVINTIKAMRLLGVQIKKKKEKYHVFGIPTGGLHEPSKTIDFGPVVNSSSPEKIYNALDIISKTRKKESAISLPRMVNANLLSVLTLCDDDLD